MKNDDIRIDPEFEKELRNKMNSLSAGVNCFDKITAQAFPESETDYEMVVSDVENVSGRFRVTPVMKIAAAAAAVVACLAVIPRTSAFQSFLANVNENNNSEFRSIIREIEDETEINTYKVYDMALSDYAKYNIMYNPLCKCPFRAGNDDTDARVRLFVRTYNDVPTNQMYAVEYTGEYKNTNFIAAAETDVRFTKEDLEALDFSDEGITAFSIAEQMTNIELDNIIEKNFYADRYGEVTGENGTQLTAASYIYDSIYKDADHVNRNLSKVVYFKNFDETEYYYDVKGENAHEIDWKRSLYTDGTSAMPTDEDEDGSMFIKISLDDDADAESSEETKFGYYEPYNSYESVAADDVLNTFQIGYSAEGRDFVTPVSVKCKNSMKIYIPNFNFMIYSSQWDPTINITIAETGISFKIHDSDLKGSGIMHTHHDTALENGSDTKFDFNPTLSFDPSLGFDNFEGFKIKVSDDSVSGPKVYFFSDGDLSGYQLVNDGDEKESADETAP